MYIYKMLKLYSNEIIKARPEWNINNLKEEKLAGLSNNNYIIRNTLDNDLVLLKIYKTNKIIDVQKIKKISKQNFCGNILCEFEQGYIQQWIKGRTLMYSDLNVVILTKIAKKLKQFHGVMNMNHNDLSFDNILLTDSGDIEFIDFEYCDDRNPEYDIGNFFCEWMYNYDQPEWWNYNIKNFPSKSQITFFCKIYLDTDDKTIIESFILNIFKQIEICHTYWIKWALKMNVFEYNLYAFLRNKLVETDLHKYILNNRVIYCDGVFDLLHSGHLKLFAQIKKIGCKKLIVGVISDKNVCSYKRHPIISLKQRCKLLKHITLVDKVIENCPFNSITKDFLDNNGIDLVTYGADSNMEDPLGIWKKHYQVALDRNAFKLIDYSHGESTTNIIKKCKCSE